MSRRRSTAWDGNVLWPLADHLGTLRDIADRSESSGITTVTNHRQYDSYGNLVDESNTAVDLLFGFTGRLFDEATDLQNNLNRWYDPAVGQWLSEDPIGFAAGDTNLYRYVGNNPISFTDPTGLSNLPIFVPREPTIWDEIIRSFGTDPMAGLSPTPLAMCAPLASAAARPAIGQLGRALSRVWPRHHPFPKYLGGAIDQTLKKIPRKLHQQFHAGLDKWKGGIYDRRRSADCFKNMDKQRIINDLREFYETAEGGAFKNYLSDFEQAVRESGY